MCLSMNKIEFYSREKERKIEHMVIALFILQSLICWSTGTNAIIGNLLDATTIYTRFDRGFYIFQVGLVLWWKIKKDLRTNQVDFVGSFVLVQRIQIS